MFEKVPQLSLPTMSEFPVKPQLSLSIEMLLPLIVFLGSSLLIVAATTSELP